MTSAVLRTSSSCSSRRPDSPPPRLPVARSIAEPDLKRSAIRFAWHTYLDLLPEGLDIHRPRPAGDLHRQALCTADSPLLIDGKPATLIRTGANYDKVTEQEFQVPAEAVRTAASCSTGRDR